MGRVFYKAAWCKELLSYDEKQKQRINVHPSPNLYGYVWSNIFSGMKRPKVIFESG